MSVQDSSRFQVTNCSALQFKPQFKVTTSGKTSRANGASLDAKLVYPNVGGPMFASGQANIASVKVDLPKQLPSRLTTLQKACLAQFQANPAGCPAASVVGIAKASTPLLPVQLTGPVYFVSHGGEAFPSLEIILQGYGVRVDLVGTTFISSRGSPARVQDRPRRPRRHVRAVPPRGQILRARRQRQPLQVEPTDADRVRRAERRGNPRVDPDQRHRLRKSQNQRQEAEKAASKKARLDTNTARAGADSR